MTSRAVLSLAFRRLISIQAAHSASTISRARSCGVLFFEVALIGVREAGCLTESRTFGAGVTGGVASSSMGGHSISSIFGKPRWELADGELLRFHHSMIYLTIAFFYKYTRGRYALNGHVTFSGLACLVLPFPVSCATGSCTRMFPFPFHVFSYLYQYGLSTRLLMFLGYVCLLLYCRLVSHLPVTDCRLVCCPSLKSFPLLRTFVIVLVVRYIYGLGMETVLHLQSTLQPP